jgi:GT2 family glycosyltransferase
MAMSSMHPCDLSIVIVSWNVWPLLQRCLASIERCSVATAPRLRVLPQGWHLEVIVVDNASADGTPAQVAAHFPWVQVLAQRQNIGFTGGNNRGFVASKGRFLYFLNPDTELVDGTTAGASLATLAARLEADPTLGVVGPQLRYSDGSPQPSARRFPRPLTGFWESTWLGRSWPGNPWTRALRMAEWPADQSCAVDWLVGAALLCRRSALEAVATAAGPFDETFFMYSEELDLCRRIRQAGWQVLYEPAAQVLHHEGKSSEQVSTQRHIHFNTSKVRYWYKWFGPRWAAALRGFLLGEYLLQIGVEGVKQRLGHRPELRRSRIEAYRAVLRSGLR